MPHIDKHLTGLKGRQTAREYLSAGHALFAEGNYTEARKKYLAAGTAPDTTPGVWRRGKEGMAKCDEKMGARS